MPMLRETAQCEVWHISSRGRQSCERTPRGCAPGRARARTISAERLNSYLRVMIHLIHQLLNQKNGWRTKVEFSDLGVVLGGSRGLEGSTFLAGLKPGQVA